MERLSRLLVLTSVALALVTHAWLTHWQPALGPAAIVAFVLGFALTHYAAAVALWLTLGTAYLVPALLSFAFQANDYHLLIVWLSALSGVLFSQADWRRWHLPPAWRPPLIGWALVIAVSWPVVAGREIDFSLIAARAVTTTNAASEVPPAVAAAFVVIAALAQLLGLLFIDLLWARFRETDRHTFRRQIILPLVAGTTIGAFVGLYQRYVDITWLNPVYWSHLNRPGGLALDGNTFGTGAALWAPLALAVTWQAHRWRWLGGAVFAILAGAMWASASRTALLVFCAGLAGIGASVLKTRGRWRTGYGTAAIVALGVLGVVAVLFAPRDLPQSNPLHRIFSRLPSAEPGEIGRFIDENFWTRFGYGQAAADIVREHPLTGVGVGAFHIVAPDYVLARTGRQVVGDNAQNWWRHQIAELGLIGAFFCVWISLLLIGLVRKDARQPTPLAGALKGVVVGMGLASVLGVPTQHPATWIAFVIVVFWLATTVSPAVSTVVAGEPSRRWIPALVLGSLLMIGLVEDSRGDLRVPHRSAHLNLPYAYGVSLPLGVSAHGEVRSLARHSVVVTRIAGRWLQLTYWTSSRSPEQQPAMVNVSIDGRDAFPHRLSEEPVSFFIESVEADSMMIETDVSGASTGAVQVASRWVSEIPVGVIPGRVIPRPR